MSKLYDLRDALKAAIVSAGIGFPEESVLIQRQGPMWNDVAVMLQNSVVSAVLMIGIAEGKPTEDDSLEMELTLPLIIVCLPQLEDGAVPEEDLWEALVSFVHDLRLVDTESWSKRFVFGGFQDLDIKADDGTSYLGRQTIFKRKFSL